WSSARSRSPRLRAPGPRRAAACSVSSCIPRGVDRFRPPSIRYPPRPAI
ncbi:MAG: hypothetical protein AVDCRST_MAG89-5294, partial [uncultured Gemmatimonadetes bacterium]